MRLVLCFLYLLGLTGMVLFDLVLICEPGDFGVAWRGVLVVDAVGKIMSLGAAWNLSLCSHMSSEGRLNMACTQWVKVVLFGCFALWFVLLFGYLCDLAGPDVNQSRHLVYRVAVDPTVLVPPAAALLAITIRVLLSALLILAVLAVKLIEVVLKVLVCVAGVPVAVPILAVWGLFLVTRAVVGAVGRLLGTRHMKVFTLVGSGTTDFVHLLMTLLVLLTVKDRGNLLLRVSKWVFAVKALSCPALWLVGQCWYSGPERKEFATQVTDNSWFAMCLRVRGDKYLLPLVAPASPAPAVAGSASNGTKKTDFPVVAGYRLVSLAKTVLALYLQGEIILAHWQGLGQGAAKWTWPAVGSTGLHLIFSLYSFVSYFWQRSQEWLADENSARLFLFCGLLASTDLASLATVAWLLCTILAAAQWDISWSSTTLALTATAGSIALCRAAETVMCMCTCCCSCRVRGGRACGGGSAGDSSRQSESAAPVPTNPLGLLCAGSATWLAVFAFNIRAVAAMPAAQRVGGRESLLRFLRVGRCLVACGTVALVYVTMQALQSTPGPGHSGTTGGVPTTGSQELPLRWETGNEKVVVIAAGTAAIIHALLTCVQVMLTLCRDLAPKTGRLRGSPPVTRSMSMRGTPTFH